MTTVSGPLPVFLPGNNRDWEKVDGIATIQDDGTISIKVPKEKAEWLIDLAKNDILYQVSFDYRMTDQQLEEINRRYQKQIKE